MIKHVFTFTGGHKLTLNDAKSLDDKMNEIATALASHAYLAILSGIKMEVNVVTNKWHNTDGYVVILGELFYVPAGNTGLSSTVPLTTATALYFSQVETVRAPSPVTYKNLVVRNVHFSRTAVLSTNVGNAGVDYISFKRYEQIMANKIAGLISVLQADSLPNILGGIQYYKDNIGRVYLENYINVKPGGINALEVIWIVPEGFRPAYGWRQSVAVVNASTGDISHNVLQVNMAGEMCFVYAIGAVSSNRLVFISGLSWLVEQ